MTYTVNVSWPATLPLPQVDYSGEPQYSTIFGATPHLRIERRSRFKRNFAVLGLKWVFTPTEFAAFKTFFTEDLANGSNQFDIELRYPKNSELTHWAICIGDAYTANYESGVWRVGATVSLIHPISF